LSKAASTLKVSTLAVAKYFFSVMVRDICCLATLNFKIRVGEKQDSGKSLKKSGE